ncbi:MAG: histidine kinase [Bacteroidota bacterium]
MLQYPYKKLLRFGLFTSPLFGLFGATPALILDGIELNRISISFLLIALTTLFFWIINIGLLWALNQSKFSANNWLRYCISVILTGMLTYFIFKYVMPLVMTPMKMPNLPPDKIQTAISGFNSKGGQFIGKGFGFGNKRFFFGLPFIQSQAINVIIMMLIEMILLKDKKQRIENENNQLRIANLEARNSQLKQQLHPHFLFNSLNTLKSLMNRSTQQAEEYLIKLSDMLRFSTGNNTQSLIKLEDEVELCINYLNMQQVRFADSLYFNIDIPTALQLWGKVPVYSMQLLIENAIKHNVLTAARPLHINISGNKEEATVTVINNLQPKQTMEEVSGVGLANLAERYELLGGEELLIKKTETQFIVSIKVIEYESGDN